jgi:TolB-like protein
MAKEDVLNSWKDISKYLELDRRTCQRWEAEFGLPVHRINNHSHRSKVFAYKSEIDQWLKERKNNIKAKKTYFFKRRWLSTGLIFVFALLTTLFAFLYFTQRGTLSPPFKSLSVAVFPVEILNPTEYDEYMSEGMTSGIINNLVRQNQLRVVPIRGAGSNNSSNNTKNIGKEYSADYLFKPQMEKNGNEIKFYALLFRIKDEKNIWNEVIEDRLGNLYALQQNICLKLFEKLNLANNQELPLSFHGGGGVDFEAYDSYLKGNYILGRISGDNDNPWKLYYKGKYYWSECTQEKNELAIKLFTEAIKINKEYAEAYIGLAQCYANYVNFEWWHDINLLNKAEEHLQKAQALNPDLPEYYSTLTEIYLLKEIVFGLGTRALAFETAQEGIKKYPLHAQMNSILGYCYLEKFGEEGDEADFKKALEYKEKSFWLFPYGHNNIVFVGLLMVHQEYNKAIEFYNTIKKHIPALMIDYLLGEIYYYKGDLDKSKAIFQQLDMPLEYNIDSLYHLAMIAARKGDRDEAQRIIQEINNKSPGENFIPDDQLKLASIHFGLGERESGYDHLKSLFNNEITKKMRHVYIKYIDIDKNFDNFKEEEEFKKIISKE